MFDYLMLKDFVVIGYFNIILVDFILNDIGFNVFSL